MDGDGNFGRQIAQLARLWRTELDNRLRPLGLSQARWVLLMHLSEAPEGLAQLDLAVRAGVTGPTLVKQIDQLESAGLVARREDQIDRRIKRVSLTKDGQRTFDAVDKIAGELRLEVLAGEDAAAVGQVINMTGRLISRFDELAKTPTTIGAA